MTNFDHSLTGRPQKNHSECPAPAREPKGLKWAGSAAFATRNIYPRGGEAIVDVLIVDRTLSRENRMNWGTDADSKNRGPLVAWAATHDVWRDRPENRKQDWFCQGNYEIEITVFAENGRPAKKKVPYDY